MSENLFRIGGVYRDVAGRPYRLYENTTTLRYPGAGGPFAWAKFLYADGQEEGSGLRSLVDGRDADLDFAWNDVRRDLLPGELHQIVGAWVPIEDPKLVALQTRPQHVEASCEEEKPASKMPTLDKLESGADLDGKRAPLPYFTEQQERAKFDPFSDFIVHHREEASVNVKPFAGLSLDAPEQFRAPSAL